MDYFSVTSLFVIILSTAQGTQINGTIYVNNEFVFYVNGVEIAADIDILHSAYNVSFEVEEGKDITFAIDARDWAPESNGGLEFGSRCVGSGWIRAMFSNGVVSDGNWTCSTYNYGPVNWNECVGSQTVRNTSLNPVPLCAQNTTPPLEGCRARLTSRPQCLDLMIHAGSMLWSTIKSLILLILVPYQPVVKTAILI